MDYIDKILANGEINGRSITSSDIGVVSPYKLQCKKIAQVIRDKGYENITVGTAEVFQGQERPIMIVSTVRSGGRHLGFVSDPQRFNVVITRAKCLLIIVGNSQTLEQSPDWSAFIKYCKQNRALIY